MARINTVIAIMFMTRIALLLNREDFESSGLLCFSIKLSYDAYLEFAILIPIKF